MDIERREIESSRGTVVAEWHPPRRAGGQWTARTYIKGDDSTIKETRHGGLSPKTYARATALRRARDIAAGADPISPGWGGVRDRPDDGNGGTIELRVRVSVDVGARIRQAAADAGESVPKHAGRLLEGAL